MNAQMKLLKNFLKQQKTLNKHMNHGIPEQWITTFM